jgi:hypothetical protein
MPLFNQTAYISPSPISIEIGGAITIPTFAMIPSFQVYSNGQLVGTGKGKYIQSFIWYPTFGGASTTPTTFTFSDLEGCSGDFLTSFPSSTTIVSAPELVYVGGSCLSAAGSNQYNSLTSIQLPKLVKISGSSGLSFTSTSLTSVNLDSLVDHAGSLNSTWNALPSLSLPSLKILMGGGTIGLNTATSINLSSIVFVGGGLGFTAPNCTTLSLPTLGTWKVLNGNFSATSIAFNQTTVDNILEALAYMDGTNSTLAFSTGRTVSITGTSSAPTNLGSTTTSGSNFVGAGTTCTVNLTSHGYATDDVLRISGITTLTNANRYARITVVNANQFTYTITSQTATGAGTATIVKAGASAKALVTRGVTLTTN